MNKKVLAFSGLALAGAAAVVGVVVPTLQAKLQDMNTVNPTNPANNQIIFPKETPIMKEIKNGYKFSLEKVGNVNTLSTDADPATAKYLLTIVENNKPEGKISFINPDGTDETSDTIEFTPGDEIRIKVTLNPDYEGYTARELKLFNVKNPNISLASKQPDKSKLEFTIQTPTYSETQDPKTGESWLYNGEQISIVPTFIKASIGVDDNQVDWEHGAYQDSLNGYVFDMDKDIKWSEAKSKIYETFQNDDPTKPIDVYFYLNGHNLILDTDVLNLDIPKGWGLNIFNNKYDTKTDLTKNPGSAEYGEIKVVEGANKTVNGKSFLKIHGYLALGRSVKFNQYGTTDGVVFYNPELLPGESIAGMENDPNLTRP